MNKDLRWNKKGNHKNMAWLESLRCHLKQFNAAWKVGLIILALVLFLGILSRVTTTFDVDQDPMVRKILVQILQKVKDCYVQAEQDSNPSIALQHIGMAKGFMQSALSIASADQIYKTTSVNMADLGFRLDQRFQQLQALKTQ